MPPQNVGLVLDILRIIFEMAARADRRTALKLVLVSRLVESWVSSILYETVYLYRQRTSNKFLRTIETSITKSSAFFSTHVKSLCILFDMPVDQVVRVTSICNGIENLTTWFLPSPRSGPAAAPLSHSLFSLRPRKLAAWHGVLRSPDPHFGAPFFSNITHLTVVNIWEEWTAWPAFSLPSLTHLSLDFTFGSRVLAEEELLFIFEAVNAILLACPRVRVCALRVDQPATSPSIASMSHRFRCEPRVVFYCHHEPFQIRGAHADTEAAIWEALQAAVARPNDSDTGPFIHSPLNHPRLKYLLMFPRTYIGIHGREIRR
ncbi:SET domain-containing protein [Mycena venus]|uniref:SET domain-containing protein n=1 Tax=Mycena venus TaxID=2733690 RepID=A0A8H6X5Z1_9AGAR|nr:SET domain-containing protein [Mycena venus]